MKQTWNKKLFWNYSPSKKTLELGLDITNKLHKLDSLIQGIFVSKKMTSRIFAFIESKYSSRIEGIYTTLFDVVNTGSQTNQQKLIKPLVDSLFSEKSILSKELILNLEKIMNSDISRQKRFDDDFGIYQTNTGDDKTIKKLIYKPPTSKKEIEENLSLFFHKISCDKNIIDIIHSHIVFEKIHPFVDANGRIGRLVFQKSLAAQMNFSYVLPVSWSLFNQISKYYSAFDINSENDLDHGVRQILDIFTKMCEVTTNFIVDLKEFLNSNIAAVKKTSTRMDEDLATRILLTLQTKSSFLQKRFKLNTRTVDSIFKKLNDQDINFNAKIINRKKAFWNVELEIIIDKYFN